MKLMPVISLAIAIAIAFSMFTLSGVAFELGHDPQTDIDDEFEETAEDSRNPEFDADEGGDSLLGSTVAAIRAVQNIIGVVAYLPSSLEALGSPGWFATIVGRTTQIIILLGIAQIIRGFEIR